MIEHINVIDALGEQISALLDLMQCAEDSVDIRSIWSAAEMCSTMHDELMAEIEKIQDDWQALMKDLHGLAGKEKEV